MFNFLTDILYSDGLSYFLGTRSQARAETLVEAGWTELPHLIVEGVTVLYTGNERLAKETQRAGNLQLETIPAGSLFAMSVPVPA